MGLSAAQSKVLANIKKVTKGTWTKARKKEAVIKGGSLPPNLVNAIAQLTKVNMDENEKKIPFISITAAILDPPECIGLKVTLTHRFQETESKTMEQIVDALASDVKLLGGDIDDVDLDGLYEILQQMVKDEVTFKFNTKAWTMGTATGVKAYIQGVCDASDVPEAEAETVEEGADTEATDAEAGEEAATEGGDDEVYVPAKGDHYLYQKVEHEVVACNEEKQTVDLKNPKSKKIVKNVAWDKLGE